MFVLCPHCQFLVALDPASGRPPAHCPRCQGSLHQPGAAPVAEATTVVADSAATTTSCAGDPDVARADVAATPHSATTIDEAAKDAAADGDESAEDAAAPLPPGTSDETLTDADLREASPPAEAAVVSEESIVDVIADAAETQGAVEPLSAEAASADPSMPKTEATASPPTTLPGRKPRSVPSFVRAPPPAPVPRRHWLRVGAIAGLTLLLGLQLLLADRARLAADARWRPMLVRLCGVLRCSLPPWREPSAFTVLSRDVRAHPTMPGVLRVTATFRNDARWPQPWPSLLLTLSDLDGRNVGARVFTATEYLGAPPTRSGLASGQSATIAMEVVEPAPRIVAFTFDFR